VLQGIKEVSDYTIKARDGVVADVYDFYFDDRVWKIRYLVGKVDVIGRKVLIPSRTLIQQDATNHSLATSLTKSEVKFAPSLDIAQPVSLQQKAKLQENHGCSLAWLAQKTFLLRLLGLNSPENAADDTTQNNSHLRSAQEILGYHIQASDGQIGYLDNLLFENNSWNIQFIVVSTHRWLPGRKVLVSPAWVQTINWSQAKIYMNLTRDSIENRPEPVELKG